MKICLAAAEFAPLAKTGGLADVCAALSAYLHRTGHQVRALLPAYAAIDNRGLELRPVDHVQEVAMDLGGRRFVYSVDEVRAPGVDPPVYLVRCPELFGRGGIYAPGEDEHLRYILLSRAALEFCQRTAFAPDIVHCHDWHTALMPIYLKTLYAWDRLFARTRSVLTIHNIGYQGIFGAGVLADLGFADQPQVLHQEDLGAGRVNFMKTGILYADALTTVSPTYAREIQGGELGMGLDDLLRRHDSLVGILNGVDYAVWDPETDPLIPHRYSAKKLAGKQKTRGVLMDELGLQQAEGRPLIGMVTRLTYQKGIDLIRDVVPQFLARGAFALAVLGSGEPRYEELFSGLERAFRDRVCFYKGFNEELAHWIEAGSDMFLMPSLFEPCGLNQMYSLRYGTVPIVRRTGGLADSVQLFDPRSGTGTGIVFRDYDSGGLTWALNTALDWYRDKKLWRRMMRNGMAMDYSWKKQGGLYVDLYRRLLGGGRAA